MYTWPLPQKRIFKSLQRHRNVAAALSRRQRRNADATFSGVYWKSSSYQRCHRLDSVVSTDKTPLLSKDAGETSRRRCVEADAW